MTTPPPTDDVPDGPVQPGEEGAPDSGWASPDAPPPGTPPAPAPSSAGQPVPQPAAPPIPVPPPGPATPHVPARTNRLAIAALVTGLLGLFPFAVGFGIAALVQAGRRGEKGKGLAAGGLAASAVWLVAGVVAAAAAAGSLLTVERDESGHVARSDKVLPGLLRVGDCFTGFSGNVRTSLVTALPCTQPHEGEVVAKLRLPDGAYPGDGEVFEQASKACSRRLTRLQKSRYDEHLQPYVVEPSRTTWRSGDREVLCLMHYEGAGKISTPLAQTLDPNVKLWHELVRGDCLGKWNDDAVAQRTLSCTEEHWMEVYAVFALKDGPYPGSKAAERQAEAGCDRRYGRVFRGARTPDLVSWVPPEKDDWTEGVRTVVCLGESEDRPLKKRLLP
ncbi:DUF4190 domain-containing protein [Actinomadura chokoriensis]|uniref:Septum formation family protein n=1 Tax=Actinomadura chokoriensis TaxID=454156 RepID=A0ABV4QYB4_9ACTN